MNLLEARIVLRDRKILDVFDLALRFLVRNAGPFAKVSLAVVAPGILLSAWAAHELGWFWGWCAASYMGLLAQAPFTELASRLVFEPEVHVKQVLWSSLKQLPRMVFVRLGQLALVLAAALFFFVPALLVAGFFFFIAEVMLLEKASFGAATTRLQRLSAGAWGDALVGLLLLLVLHVGCTILGDVAGRAIIEELLSFKAPEPAFQEGGSVLALAGFWCILPFVAITRFLLYLNVRTRAEGWDVQTRFAAIAARAELERLEREAV